MCDDVLLLAHHHSGVDVGTRARRDSALVFELVSIPKSLDAAGQPLAWQTPNTVEQEKC